MLFGRERSSEDLLLWPDESPRRPPRRPLLSSRRRVLLALSCCAFIYALRNFLRPIFAVLFFSLFFYSDVILARLATWGISKSPKHFEWTIESIAVRPSLFTGKKSEIVVAGWTWRNPPDFPQSEFILNVRRMTIELDLWSILDAIRDRTAIRVAQIHLDGVDFFARRNAASGALNLWVALDLPDQDVNAVVKTLGDMHAMAASPNAAPLPEVVQPLPTREAPRKPDEKKKSSSRSSPFCCSTDAVLSQAPTTRLESGVEEKDDRFSRVEELAAAPDRPPPPLKRQDTMIGDPKRRPRWGVPLLLQVERTMATKINVDVMDLLTGRKYSRARSKLSVNHVCFNGETLARGEAKRRDGVYLGELVWMLIHVLVQKIVRSKPSRLVTASTLAAAFAATDFAHYTVARTLEMAINSRSEMSRFLLDRRRLTSGESLSTVKVELVRARRLCVHHGDRGSVSCNVVVMLRRCSSSSDNRFAVVDRRSSDVRMWNRNPTWNYSMELGPINSLKTSEIVVVCVHRGNVIAGGGTVAVGEVVIPLVSVFTRATLATRHHRKNHNMDVVAWFRLSPPTEASSFVVDSQATTSSRPSLDIENDGRVITAPVNLLVGEVKLGLKLTSPQNCVEFAHLETLRRKQ